MPEELHRTCQVRASVVSLASEVLLEWLRSQCEVVYIPNATDQDLLAPNVAESTILVVRSNVMVSRQVLAAMTNLRVLVRLGSGTDNIDTAALAARGVKMLRLGSETSARAVAELALQAALSLLRYVPMAAASLTAGKWEKNKCAGEEICGSTVGVWGAGPVGCAVASVFNRLDADVRFAAYQSLPSGLPAMDPIELCRTAALHIFALPLRPSTHRFVGSELLSQLSSRTPHLVNVGRWELFDMPAVVAALAHGQLAGVAVDPVDMRHMTTVDELLKPFKETRRSLNLQLTPHLGAMTTPALERTARAAIAALELHWSTVFATRETS
jgi:D-3-phosphoglycerate dehydrogenase / 2-oxoglutarate reductase